MERSGAEQPRQDHHYRHHHVLRNTTTISHPFGGKGIHANNTGDFEGASFLYYIIENSDPENFAYSTSSEAKPGPFEVFLEQFEREHGYPAIDLWVGAHSHAQATDVIDGKGLIEEKWGVTFMQVSAMTHYHSGRTPMSWHLSLSPNDDKIAIKNYIHRAPYYNHIPKEIMLSKGVNRLADRHQRAALKRTAGTHLTPEPLALDISLSRHPQIAGLQLAKALVSPSNSPTAITAKC